MGLAEISRFDHPVLNHYLVDGAYDETFESPGKPRPHYAPLLEMFSSLPADEIRRRKHSADLSFPESGHHLHGVWPRGGDRANFSLRSFAAADHQRGMEPQSNAD